MLPAVSSAHPTLPHLVAAPHDVEHGVWVLHRGRHHHLLHASVKVGLQRRPAGGGAGCTSAGLGACWRGAERVWRALGGLLGHGMTHTCTGCRHGMAHTCMSCLHGRHTARCAGPASDVSSAGCNKRLQAAAMNHRPTVSGRRPTPPAPARRPAPPRAPAEVAGAADLSSRAWCAGRLPCGWPVLHVAHLIGRVLAGVGDLVLAAAGPGDDHLAILRRHFGAPRACAGCGSE